MNRIWEHHAVAGIAGDRAASKISIIIARLLAQPLTHHRSHAVINGVHGGGVTVDSGQNSAISDSRTPGGAVYAHGMGDAIDVAGMEVCSFWKCGMQAYSYECAYAAI